MRKKVFLIHGRGVKNGLGEESGGDLDTISSNAFYGYWMSRKANPDSEYGRDFEFDFVNYHEGLRHLDIHENTDLYLPDFPIDALAPGLQMHKMSRPEEVTIRCQLYKNYNSIRRNMYRNTSQFPESWKHVYNDLNKRISKYLENRKFFENYVAQLYSSLLDKLVREVSNSTQISEPVNLIADYCFGSEYETVHEKVLERMDSYLKRNCIELIDTENVQSRLLLSDSAGSDYGYLARARNGCQLLSTWVEGVSLLAGTYFLLEHVGDDLPEEKHSELLDWTESIRNEITTHCSELHTLINKIVDANPDHERARDLATVSKKALNFWKSFQKGAIVNDYIPKPDLFRVHVTEQASGRPVPNLEVVFNVMEGSIGLSPENERTDEPAQSISVLTDDSGEATVKLNGLSSSNRFGVSATYNDLNFVTYPSDFSMGAEYFEQHPEPDSVEMKLMDYLVDTDNYTSDETLNLDQIEEGSTEGPDRSIQVQKTLIERDLKHLAEHDVRLIRIDDHHPYTPEILDKLESLKESGYMDSITLSSLERGKHQPKEDQLCGADLIYQQFIENSEIDNEGLADLCHITHLQDLHIRPNERAIQLSKLIGSKYSKVDMAKGLMQINSQSDYDQILSITNWDEKIRKYENRLQKVLPRVETTLYQIKLLIPPDTSYKDEVGMNRYYHPFEWFFGNESGRQKLLQDLYGNQEDQFVNIFCALSPFCDPEKGEPSINVASAQNYLTERHDIDYLFYAYGSVLLSTRRTNEEGYDIDLSDLVSQIGSPADGGHPGAATGAPENNPAFPQDRFDKINDQNFAEYMYYLTDIVEAQTGLEAFEINEVYPTRFEPGMRKNFSELEKNLVRLVLRGKKGVAQIIVAQSIYSNEDDPNLTMPLAIAHLDRKIVMDYFFYSISSSNLCLRNVSDRALTLNLDKIARTLGSPRDGGHPKAANCQPRFNPDFPEEKFQNVNYENYEKYVEYLGNTIADNYGFQEVTVKRIQI